MLIVLCYGHSMLYYALVELQTMLCYEYMKYTQWYIIGKKISLANHVTAQPLLVVCL